MPLYAAVSAALPPASPRSRHVDEVAATNCYTSGGCCPPSEVSGAAAPAQQRQQQQAEASALDAAQQQAAVAAPRRGASGASLPASCSSDSLAATAAASSTPALAASAAEPAVRDDLTVERVCMLLLAAPRVVWREVGSEPLRREINALLDTSAHSGGAPRARTHTCTHTHTPSLCPLPRPTPHPGDELEIILRTMCVWPGELMCPLKASSLLLGASSPMLAAAMLAPPCDAPAQPHASSPSRPATRSGGRRSGVPCSAAGAAAPHAAGAGGERGNGPHLLPRPLPHLRRQRRRGRTARAAGGAARRSGGRGTSGGSACGAGGVTRAARLGGSTPASEVARLVLCCPSCAAPLGPSLPCLRLFQLSPAWKASQCDARSQNMGLSEPLTWEAPITWAHPPTNNAPALAVTCGSSRPTASRTVDSVRDQPGRCSRFRDLSRDTSG